MRPEPIQAVVGNFLLRMFYGRWTRELRTWLRALTKGYPRRHRSTYRRPFEW